MEEIRFSRCASWARVEGVDLGGTAGRFGGILAIEWPAPWPRDVTEVGVLAEVCTVAAAADVRVQLILSAGPQGHSEGRGGVRRLAFHRRPPGPSFAGFTRRGCSVAPADVVGAALDLLDGGAGNPQVAGASDILVCSHGSRDACCGTAGTRLVGALAADVPAGVSLWRTSHLGGHRFAANALLLPEGTMWGQLDRPLVDRLLRRVGPVADLLAHYRGCIGLGPAPVQALERAVLGVVGWDLLSWPRSGGDLGDGRFQLRAESPDGLRSWAARVSEGRLLPVPNCGQSPDQATKFEAEWLVDGLCGESG